MKRIVVALIGLSCISLSLAIPAEVVHPGTPDAGAESFKRYCAGCHSVEPEHKLIGPSLCSEMRGPHRKSTKNVREIIVEGSKTMPRFGSLLSEQELADLLAYIRTL